MDLAGLLKSTFGFSAFRANQEAVCRAATDGRDVLLVMPTGAGKSLCYQLPAIARGGTGLVVSPLIALMDDQANKLTSAGLKVARIHSGMSREDSRQACRDYLDGKLQFLFIAPERMRVPNFPEMLARKKPSLIAIDEAHCISAWGHDFRPDYRTLGDFLPALRPAPVIALTATATPTVQKDIVTQLHLAQPALFIHGFRRENLAIEVVELSKPRRPEFITEFLSQKERRPAIVYAPSRKAAEELAGLLGKRFNAAAYHAGLEAGVRERVQRHFLTGKVEVVVATIAFGMGIDKADVRTVMHAALPASVEAYYQEIGRAGRDGDVSRTVLLYSYADRKMHDFFLDRDYPASTELRKVSRVLTEEWLMPDVLANQLKMDREVFGKAVEKLATQGAAQVDLAGNVRRTAHVAWQSGYEQQIGFRRSQIDRMMQFAQTQQCRMCALIRHFGDLADAHKPCGHCDFCSPTSTAAQTFTEPDAAQDRDLRKILQALQHGVMKATGKLQTELGLSGDRKTFDSLLEGLARAGLAVLMNETFTAPDGRSVAFKKIGLTPEGQSLGSGEPIGVLLGHTDGMNGTASKRRSASTPPGCAEKQACSRKPVYSASESKLEESLRTWRKLEAGKTGKPAFMIFSDACLHAIVTTCPQTIPHLLQIAGIGPDKADRYGAAICAVCSGKELPGEYGIPAAVPVKLKRAPRKEQVASSDPDPIQRVDPAPRPTPTQRTAVPELFESLSAKQQALEQRLREWRKNEAEKMGLPQFFVLGTNALRAIVLTNPETILQLQKISGIAPDKLDRFGASILAVCHEQSALSDGGFKGKVSGDEVFAKVFCPTESKLLDFRLLTCFSSARSEEMANGDVSSGNALRLKIGLAEMLKGGVIMDVMNVEQAIIAEQAGAVAVMALERVPAMIRAEGGVARMSHPTMIKDIMKAVSIPVMAKVRIGHFVEAQILEHLGVEYIDESEVLTPADELHHIDKHAFKTAFVCGAKDLGEALRRISEGAAMIRTKGEPGTGDVIHAVKHMRKITSEIKALTVLTDQELYAAAKELRAPLELVQMVARAGQLPVPNFSAGGIATPADAALMMQLGAQTVFVGSGIFMKEGNKPLNVSRYDAEEAEMFGQKPGDFWNPEERAEAESRAKAIVRAATHYTDPAILAEASEDCVGAMKGLAVGNISEPELMQNRGW